MDSMFQQMDDWYAKTPGQQLLRAERLALAPWLQQCQGEYLLQIGGPNQLAWFEECPIPYRIRLSPESSPSYPGPSLQAGWDELPFLSNTLDVVLLPHVIEHSNYPRHLLEEIHRVLVAEGQLLMLSFNPYSLWGLVKSYRSTQTWPWRGRFWGPFRLRRWLNEQGFELLVQKTILFRPPLSKRAGIKLLRFMEPVGQLCWPYFGAVNIIVAKKTVLTVTPIKAARHKRPVRVSEGYLEPSTRQAHSPYQIER